MKHVWLVGAETRGSSALRASLQRAGHDVTVVDLRADLPDVVVVEPTKDDPPAIDNGSVQNAALPVLLVSRPFSPATVLAAIDAGTNGAADVVIDLTGSGDWLVDHVDLMERLDALVADVHRAAQRAPDGIALQYEGVLHHLSRANVTLLEALSFDS